MWWQRIPGAAAPLALVGVLALLLTAGPGASAQEPKSNKSDGKVKVKAKASTPDADGNQTVTIDLTVEEGWHLYANPPGQDDLKPVQTTVTITAATKPQEVKITYPEGTLHKDATLGDYFVYEDKVTIKAKVLRAAGDDSPLEISIKLQACNATTCLPPGTVKLKVP
jgi:DsbC/DsbD-like thiol-disulfide interchange protein